MTANERLAMVRNTLKLPRREFAKKIPAATGYIASMETGSRKVNPRIMKWVSAIFDVDLHWLETGEGEMFNQKAEQEISEIIALYKKLNPFFKRFIMKQLRELIKHEEE